MKKTLYIYIHTNIYKRWIYPKRDECIQCFLDISYISLVHVTISEYMQLFIIEKIGNVQIKLNIPEKSWIHPQNVE